LLLCGFLKDRKAFLLVFGTWTLIAPFIAVGGVFRSFDALSGIDRIATGMTCASGLALGISLLKGKIG